MIEVTLYTRKDCHLCEIARQYLDELQSIVPHQVTMVDIDSDPKLQKLYTFTIPVIKIGPYTLSAPIEKKDVEISLLSVQHGIEQEEALDKAIEEGRLKVQVTWTKSDTFSHWLAKHYLAIFNIFIFIYVGVPFLAPVFMRIGAAAPAKVIYKAYSYVCHQFAFRSWFLFGEQAVYPRAEAGVSGLITYQQATGMDGNDIISARAFEGNPQLGYKVALCERDVAIYGGILLFGLLFAVARRRIKPIHFVLWILLAIVPIGVDGFSQLISQLPFHLIPYRESTPLLRTLTGFLFGFITAWFGYPYVEESMAENKKYMDAKLARFQKFIGAK